MKKFACCLLASLACFQSSFAINTLENQTFIGTGLGATSALSESINEMEAILQAIGTNQFPDVISSTEFAITLFRETKKLDVTGKIKYILETCTINANNQCRRNNRYQITIRVTPNPGIGPNQIEVLKIKPLNLPQNLFEGAVNQEIE